MRLKIHNEQCCDAIVAGEWPTCASPLTSRDSRIYAPSKDRRREVNARIYEPSRERTFAALLDGKTGNASHDERRGVKRRERGREMKEERRWTRMEDAHR